MTEPIRDVAHLGHVELMTPDLEASREFFLELFGLHETDTTGESVYLRGFGDYDRTTLKLTQGPTTALGHVAWRAVSPEALERRVRAIEATGLGEGWIDGDIGHGKAYRFQDPDGHVMEIYYESERFEASPEQRSYLLNQPQAFEAKGASARRIDHLSLMCHDLLGVTAFMEEQLGFRVREEIVRGSKRVVAMMSVTPSAHDLAALNDRTGARGRFHHLAYAVDSREDVMRAASLMLDKGVFVECSPAFHPRSQGFGVYMYEPGGNRVEIYTGGYIVLAPDWPTVTWNDSAMENSATWGPSPASFFTHGSPPVEGDK